MEKQETILRNMERAAGQIKTQNSVGMSNMQSANEMQRTQNINILSAADQAFTELIKHIQEGNKFYDDLTKLILSTQDKIRDYTLARDMEATTLASTVGESAAAVPEN